MPMLAGVGLMMVCCSSLSAFMMMGDEEKKDPVVPKTPAKKTPEQIKADEAKAALALVKADPNVTAEEVAAAQLVADNAQAAADDADETFTIPTEQDSLNECYGARYTDLRAAFGTDKAALGGHYTTYTTNGAETRDNSCTLSDAEAQCYLDRYPAVQAYAGTNLKLARKHYYEVGMGVNNDFVCPPGKKEFQCYLDRYPDLQDAFGTDLQAARTHWVNHGKGESRDYSCP
jgi:hypothetical protein